MFLSLFFSWQNWDLERLSNLVEITKPNGAFWIWRQIDLNSSKRIVANSTRIYILHIDWFVQSECQLWICGVKLFPWFALLHVVYIFFQPWTNIFGNAGILSPWQFNVKENPREEKRTHLMWWELTHPPCSSKHIITASCANIFWQLRTAIYSVAITPKSTRLL